MPDAGPQVRGRKKERRKAGPVKFGKERWRSSTGGQTEELKEQSSWNHKRPEPLKTHLQTCSAKGT